MRPLIFTLPHFHLLASASHFHPRPLSLPVPPQVDFDRIDPSQRKAIEDQIMNFGQTPSQLLTRPHPARRPPTGVVDTGARASSLATVRSAHWVMQI